MLHILQIFIQYVVLMENTAVFNANSLNKDLQLRLNILGVNIAVINLKQIGEHATTVS